MNYYDLERARLPDYRDLVVPGNAWERDSTERAILFELGRASGAAGNPINKSNHAVAILLCRDLFFAIKGSEVFELLTVRQELSDEDHENMEQVARQGLSEVASKYREQLEKITPEMLEAEAEAACRLLEEKHHDDDRGNGRDQSVNSQSSRAIESLLGEEGEKILRIAHSDDTVDDKMRAICDIDRRLLAWKSPPWAELLRVSEHAIRKTKFWKEVRPKVNEADRDD